MKPCKYCGEIPTHVPESCPRVSAIEYHGNGALKRIELMTMLEFYENSAMEMARTVFDSYPVEH